MFSSFKKSFLVFLITFCVGALIFGTIALIVVPKINDLLGFNGSSADIGGGPAVVEVVTGNVGQV